MLDQQNSDVVFSDVVFNALGDQSRRKILSLLRNGPLAVGEIATQLPISRPAVSKHLRILEEAGLVGYQETGTRNIFYLQTVGFQAARAFLELFWNEALANFKQFSEGSGPLDEQQPS